MLIQAEGNLLEADVEALVNTVNTVGVMGKGIALQFKRAYPENFKRYNAVCSSGEFDVGQMLVYETGWMTNPKFIVNFPTKRHWRANSRIEDIKSGLTALRKVIVERKIASIAVPPLGCGNGGLKWSEVEPLITEALGSIPGVDVYVYAPLGAPAPADMPVRTKRPRLTRFGAALINACNSYIDLSLDAGLAVERKLSLLEVHKVAYFLQTAGWPGRLSFDQGHYGPYAKDLDHFISSVEGHFVYGYGDGTGGSKAVLEIDQRASLDAKNLMLGDEDFSEVMLRFCNIVSGFEFAYGVELLSTVHFIAVDKLNVVHGLDAVVKKVEEWSPRKRALFKSDQTAVAYEHLVNCSLIGR
jgi:O-acetyl-ADP-ribose deacetylase (regulator of RNase III)